MASQFLIRKGENTISLVLMLLFSNQIWSFILVILYLMKLFYGSETSKLIGEQWLILHKFSLYKMMHRHQAGTRLFK